MDEEIKQRFLELERKITEVCNKLDDLLNRSPLITVNPVTFPEIYVDHICVGIDGNTGISASCIYCHPNLILEAERDSKISPDRAKEIKSRLAAGENTWDIADSLMVAQPLVMAIRKGIIFNNV